jgi:DNA-binding MarR family transcriptional regulator
MLARDVLRTVPRSIRVIRRLASEKLDGEFSLNHMRILALINDGGGPSEMTMALQVSPPAISRMLQCLEAKGLIKRSQAKDRRFALLALTFKGRKALSKVNTAVEEMINNSLDELSTSERRELTKGLSILEKR